MRNERGVQCIVPLLSWFMLMALDLRSFSLKCSREISSSFSSILSYLGDIARGYLKGASMSDAIDEFLAGYPLEIQAISRTLRAMACEAMPGAPEMLFASQNHFAYAFNRSRRDSIVYICPMRDYVRLGFMYGTHLNDSERLLVGEGKRLRHIKIKTVEEANRPAVRRLVEEAWTDAQTHMKKRV